jgi:hypothetical protein
MNADKTDISNTNRVQESNARYYTSRGRNQLESQSAGDLHAEKQRSTGSKQNQRYHEITKSLSDGSTINPTGVQKVTTGNNGHKGKSVGEMEEVPRYLQGIFSIN